MYCTVFDFPTYMSENPTVYNRVLYYYLENQVGKNLAYPLTLCLKNLESC
jgi:hypothetical protein